MCQRFTNSFPNCMSLPLLDASQGDLTWMHMQGAVRKTWIAHVDGKQLLSPVIHFLTHF